MKVFLSGAMSGLDTKEYTDWRINASNLIKQNGHIPIDPAYHFNFTMPKNSYTEEEIMSYDLACVKNCDVILVNLKHDSIGTSIELFRAKQLEKPVIGYGAHDNLHPWMGLCVNKFCNTLENAITYIDFHYSELF